MHLTEALEQVWPGLLNRVHAAIQVHSLNQRTRQHYLHWITRFVMFCESKAPESLEAEDRQQFLLHLQGRAQLSQARLNQASQALAFFFEKVLGKPADNEDTLASTTSV